MAAASASGGESRHRAYRVAAISGIEMMTSAHRRQICGNRRGGNIKA